MTQAQIAARMLQAVPDSRRVRLGAVVSYGILRITDETVENDTGANIRKRLIVLTLATDAIPLLAEDSTVIVYASKLSTSTQTSYKVRDKLLVDDGALTKWRLVPAS